MNEQYEIIRFDSAVPMKLRCIYLENMPSHWHRGVELILVLSGMVDIVHGGDVSHLSDDDLIVINENTIHSLDSVDGCTLVSLQIDTAELFDKRGGKFFCLQFLK